MVLGSSSFEDGHDIPQKHGKKRDNVSPVHWLVLDIDARATSLNEGASGTEMAGGSREMRPYTGPFPPSGTHEYEFTLHALDTDRLDVPKKVSFDAFTNAVEPHTLATASLVGRFTKIRTT
jgi:Raf kinase inhibitor-like YbhB/YbcL family protein